MITFFLGGLGTLIAAAIILAALFAAFGTKH